jgi:Resolvase, N terminal domain
MSGTEPNPRTRPVESSKITDAHRAKLAVVYVRQSTPQQVAENRESLARQYALADHAHSLGWPTERVLVIDEDLGLSGRTADIRLGFQRLLAEVTMDHVGLVLGLEMSRLSRSCKDWHHLLEVCGIFDARLVQLACYFAGIGIIPVGWTAIIKHAGSRADILLGSGMLCLLSLLCILLGMLSHRNIGLQGKLEPRARWPEFASYPGCFGTLVAGIGLLSDLGVSPAQITLGLLVTGSMSISVLALGMTMTLVRSQNG